MSDWGFLALGSKFLLTILIPLSAIKCQWVGKNMASNSSVLVDLLCLSSANHYQLSEVLPYQLHTGTSSQVFPIDPLKTLVVMKPLSGRTEEDTSPNQ